MQDLSSSKSWSFLRARVDLRTAPNLNALIEEAVGRNERRMIGNHNLHSVYLFCRDSKFRAFFDQAHHIHVDGMPLIFLGRLFGVPIERCHRVTYADWLGPLLAEAVSHRWRMFHLGSRSSVERLENLCVKAMHSARVVRHQLDYLRQLIAPNVGPIYPVLGVAESAPAVAKPGFCKGRVVAYGKEGRPALRFQIRTAG